MNIPKGWPTEEMIEAGREAMRDDGFQDDDVGEADLESIFIRMYEAAPAPPAPAELDDIDIKGIALDCGFKLKQQPDGTEDLNPYVYRFAREILATMPSVEDVTSFAKAMAEKSATLPAQEAGPVAWLISFECDGMKMRNVAMHNAVADYRDIDPNAISIPLYTHPANDKLRKAAEEAIIEAKKSGYLSPAIENLRAALDGKE